MVHIKGEFFLCKQEEHTEKIKVKPLFSSQDHQRSQSTSHRIPKHINKGNFSNCSQFLFIEIYKTLTKHIVQVQLKAKGTEKLVTEVNTKPSFIYLKKESAIASFSFYRKNIQRFQTPNCQNPQKSLYSSYKQHKLSKPSKSFQVLFLQNIQSQNRNRQNQNP